MEVCDYVTAGHLPESAVTKKSKRGVLIALAVGILTASAILVMSAMRENIVFFHTPSDLMSGKVSDGAQTRIGGMVEKGSLERLANGLDFKFRVTDGVRVIPVRYTGILPDLFREEQGVVAEGKLRQGNFEASSVLAKHDENYMPREVSEALKNYKPPVVGK